MKAAQQQLAEWDAELNQLHERNGDLGLKVQSLEQELSGVRWRNAAPKASQLSTQTAKFIDILVILTREHLSDRKRGVTFEEIFSHLPHRLDRQQKSLKYR